MARGSKSSPDGNAPHRPPGLLGGLFLLFCRPLPAAVSLRNLICFTDACAGFFGRLLAALLVFTAPLSIPLLVWTALGAHHSACTSFVAQPGFLDASVLPLLCRASTASYRDTK